MISTIKRISDLVALPHSVFALPYALAAAIFASNKASLQGIETGPREILLIICAVVTARTAAMAFNRLIDHEIDLKNPRTETRPLPSGTLSRTQVWSLVIISSGLFITFAGLLGNHCLVLSPLVLFVLLGYSLTKRFTSYCHVVLGLALALAPGGAWWAIYPSIETLPLLLMASVLFWVAGFDILYSCQDEYFDKEYNLFSVPAKFGIKNALRISSGLHTVSFIGFVLVGVLAKLSVIYYIGMGLIAIPFLGQHLLVKPNDLSKVNRAFFTFNGVISIAYLGLILISI